MSADHPTAHSTAPFEGPKPQAVFATTRWSMVVAAGGAEAIDAHEALANLCQTYWTPLYHYVRRRGHSPDDAQDLTQEFFARLLARNWLGNAKQEKGRFRSFLLGAMNHFLADEWDKRQAQKRGGGIPDLPLQIGVVETRLALEPADHATPDQNFERRWFLTLLDKALNRLQEEYERDGRSEVFTLLHPCLVGERAAQPYAELAKQLGTTEGTVKSAVHRIRQRHRQLVREEIGQTVVEPNEIEDELRHMFTVLGG